VKITIHYKAAHARYTNRAMNVGATPPAPPYNECPPVGLDTSCGLLIQATDSGYTVLQDPSQGPFDGAEDTLIGVLNSSSSTINSIAVSADTDLFGFDGDGLCTQSPAPSGCPFGSTSYEGPNTSFSNINAGATGGMVDFTGGLAPGATAYFSLEEPLTSVFTGGPTTAEQGGASNPSEKSTTCSTSHPVNCATGVFWHTFTDFTVPGRGVPLAFTRTYSSSQSGTDGPLGFGWTDNYNMSLATDSSGNVTISQEDGSAVTFNNNGDGTFSPPPRVLATLVQNSDGSYTFTRDQGQISYNFAASGELTSISDLNGYTTTLAYSGGNLTSVTDPAGRQLTFTYTGSHIAKVTDPMGRTMSFSYDGSGNLVKTTDAAGRIWSFSYDSGHELLTMTDPRGGVTTNTYNSSGQVTSQTDPDSGTTTFSYSGDAATQAGGTTTMTDPNGNVTSYAYANLELTSVTHGAGTSQAATTSYTYDPATLGVTSVTGPNSNVTTSTYDSNGNLLSVTDPLGDTTSYNYNSLNEVTSKTSPLGQTTSYNYDGNGNLLSVTDTLGNPTTYAYSDSAHPGDITSVTDPDSNVTSYTYDTNGDLATVSVSPSSGVTDTTAYAYDADGERTCEASPDATAAGVHCPPAASPPVSDTTASSYNSVGEVISVTDPNGHVTSYAYDGDGNVIQVTDPKGNVTQYTYNGNNQQIKVTRPGGSTRSMSYDADGNLVAETDPGGNVTRYTYDALNRVTSMTNALGKTISYGYDAVGNRTSLTDPSGAATSFSYNMANELTAIAYSDGTTPGVTYTYDPDGHRVTMIDGTGTTSYSYDADGRLTSATNGAGSTVSYGYDPAGKLTTLTYPNGKSVTRTYDGAGQLSSVSDWLGHKTTFGYDASGNLTRDAYPNGVTAATVYDNANQVTSITDKTTSATLAQFNYTRDNNNDVASSVTTGITGGTENYGYTSLSQLASRSGKPFTYDAADNLTRFPTGVTQAFNAGDELTSSTVPASTKAPALDQSVSANQTGHGTKITSPPVSTQASGELLLAFISASGPSTGSQTITGVTGGALVWKEVARANKQAGTAEIWQAYAATPVTSAAITATLGAASQDGSITVAAFTGAAPVVGAHATANGNSTHPAVSLTTKQPHSLVWAAGEDPTHASTLTPVSGQAIVHQDADTTVHATYWAQNAAKAVATANTTVTIADTLPSTDHWNLTAVEIQSATATTVNTSYSYDPQGNLTKIGASNGPATTLGYDQANRLISYGGIATYAYNGDGLRMSKSISGTITQFTWDTSGALPLLLVNGRVYFIYGPSGQPIEHISGKAVNDLQTDQQGSVRLMTNSAGQNVGTYNYTAYGQTLGHTGTATSVLQYDGQFTDPESGLIYLRARYYNPATGQFLTQDPLQALTEAPYSYVGDDPLNGTDSLGLCWPSWACGAEHVVGGVGTNAWNATGGQAVNFAQGVIEHGRLPDYVNLNVGGVFPLLGPVGLGGGFNVTVTRNGHIYYGPEGGAGIAGVSGTFEAGWIDQASTPTPCQLDQFVQGWGLTVNGYVPVVGVPGVAGIGPAGGETWGNEGGTSASDFGTNVGIGFGGGHNLGVMQGYNFRAPFNLPEW
jgi:RHS repeat-associated protein